MVACGVCNGKVTRVNTALDCSTCKISIHEACSGLSPSSLEAVMRGKAIYKCNKCKTSRRSSISESPPTIIAINNKLEELTALMNRSNNMLEKATESIDDLRTENKELRGMIDEMREDRIKTDKRISDLESRLAQLQGGGGGAGNLEDQLQRLQMDSDDNKQQLLLNTLEVQNIPEEMIQPSGSQTVIAVFKNALDIDIQEDEIMDVQPVKVHSERGGNMFLVRLSNATTRQRIVAARKRKHCQSGFRGVYLNNTEHRIYVNERLTQRRRQLLKEAKDLRKKLGFKFVWVDGGRILMRKKEGDKVFQINSFSDFEKLPKPPAN